MAIMVNDLWSMTCVVYDLSRSMLAKVIVVDCPWGKTSSRNNPRSLVRIYWPTWGYKNPLYGRKIVVGGLGLIRYSWMRSPRYNPGFPRCGLRMKRYNSTHYWPRFPTTDFPTFRLLDFTARLSLVRFRTSELEKIDPRRLNDYMIFSILVFLLSFHWVRGFLPINLSFFLRSKWPYLLLTLHLRWLNQRWLTCNGLTRDGLSRNSLTYDSLTHNGPDP